MKKKQTNSTTSRSTGFLGIDLFCVIENDVHVLVESLERKSNDINYKQQVWKNVKRIYYQNITLESQISLLEKPNLNASSLSKHQDRTIRNRKIIKKKLEFTSYMQSRSSAIWFKKFGSIKISIFKSKPITMKNSLTINRFQKQFLF